MTQNKPAIPMKNLVLFLLASVCIMFVWTWVENKFWPKLTDQHRREMVEHLTPLFNLTGSSPAEPWTHICAELSRKLPAAARVKAVEEMLATRKKEEETKPKPPPVAKFEPAFVELGGPDYNLQVRLTNRGGGVDRVIVTNFPQADKYGKAVLGSDGKPQPLHLISSPFDRPEAERDTLTHDELLPSFLLFHYASPDELRPEPFLGEIAWKPLPRPADTSDGKQEAAYQAELPDHGVRITKTFSLEKDHYHVNLAVKIEKLPGANPKPLRYQLAGGRGLPIEGVWYTSVYRNFITGWSEKGSNRRHIETAAEIQTTLGSERINRGESEFQYAAVVGQYFAVATCIDDEQEKRNFIEYTRGTAEGGHPKEQPMLGDITSRMISEATPIGDKPIEHKFILYHGPIKVRQLYQMPEKAVPDSLVERYEKNLGLKTMTDFHSPSAIGRFADTIGWTDVTIAFTNVMHSVLGFLMRTLRVPALAILALTVLVRLLLMPLSRKQTQSMAKLQEKMAAMQPKLKALEEEYKNRDKQEFQQAKMKLMLANGVNPAAQLGGCLLMFVQMPVFMGLYYALQENVFFRLKTFLWIDNLAAPDMLVWWGEAIPGISNPANLGALYYLGPYFNVLPFIAVGLMLVQQWLMTPPPTDETQAQQQKMMKWMMIVFAIFFYKTPSGLVMYFIASSLWGLAERKLFPKKKVVGQTDDPGDSGGSVARLKDKPEPPTETWLQRKTRELLEAAEKKHNTERRVPQQKRRPR